jgi:hypothetical protein
MPYDDDIQFAVGDKEALHTEKIKKLTDIVNEVKQEVKLSPEDEALIQQALAGGVEDTLKGEALYDEE